MQNEAAFAVRALPASTQVKDVPAAAEEVETSRAEALATLRLRLESQKTWCGTVANKVQQLQEAARKAEEAAASSSGDLMRQIAEVEQEAAAAQTLCAALESQKAELEKESEAFGKSLAARDVRTGPY